MLGLCRNGPPMDIAAPGLPSVDIAAEESVESGADMEASESRSSKPGTPPAHKREPPDLSDRARFPSQPGEAANDAASAADAHDVQQKAPKLVDPAQPAAPEQQRLDPEAAFQPRRSFLDDQAHSEDGPLLCRSAAWHAVARYKTHQTPCRRIQSGDAPQAYATAERRVRSRSALTTARTMREPPLHPRTTTEQAKLPLVREAPSTMPSGLAKRTTVHLSHPAPHPAAAAASRGAGRRAATAAPGRRRRRTGRASVPR